MPIDTVLLAARLAVENELLEAALCARLEELRASRARIVEAQAEARRLLERDLHDGVQQRLVALALELRLAEARAGRDPSTGCEALAYAQEQLAQALAELRDIAHGIHPALLSARGLRAAVEALAARTPLPVTVVLERSDARLPKSVEVAAHYVAAEALTNVVKYAAGRPARPCGSRATPTARSSRSPTTASAAPISREAPVYVGSSIESRRWTAGWTSSVRPGVEPESVRHSR